MARGKKKESALTPEEKLAQALVPDWEQPYKVPKNWCWTRTGSIAEVASGGTPSSSVAEYYEGGTIPWISPADLSGYNDIYISSGAKNITELGLEKSSARLLPADTVCLSSRAPIGYVAIAQNPLCTNQGFKNFMPSTCYLPKYLYWYLKGNKELLESYASGTTFLELSGSKATVVEIPLAPLAEQQRIVDRIEYLFGKLDEAKEKARSVLDSFETRKAAIFHKAFTGELTAKWRAEHGISDDTWVGKPLADFLQLITYGFTNPMPDADEGPWKITAKSVHDGYIDYEISRKTTQEAFDNLLTDKSRPLVNDVLLTKDGSIGRVAVVDRPGICINQSVALLRPTEAVRPEFLRDMLLSPQHQRTMELQAGGTALKHIYITRVDKMMVSVPSVIEQEEVCKIVKSLMTKEQQAKEAAEVVLEKIDLLKKSILARAFRSELGTNDPTEESALELLKSVL